MNEKRKVKKDIKQNHDSFSKFYDVLVIGNGFDIAHGYKTKYDDFFRFLGRFKYLINSASFDNRNKYVTRAYFNKIGKENFFEECKHFFCNDSNNLDQNKFWHRNGNKKYFDALTAIKSYIYDCDGEGSENVWYRFLDDKLRESKNTYRNIGWSGVEGEIRNIVLGIENDNKLDTPYPLARFSQDSMMPIRNYFQYIDNDMKTSEAGSYKEEKDAKIGYFRRMSKDLERLTLALDLYMSVFVPIGDSVVRKIKELEEVNFEAVINFNYTQTCSKIYGSKCKCYCVHGTATAAKLDDKTKLILGIDDDLNSNEFIEYKKFYQRIIRNSDMSYIDEIKDKKVRTVFWGHSMSDIDGDVLSGLLAGVNDDNIVYSIICAYSEEDRRSKVKNVAKIIGKEKLIKLTSGKNTRLKFILQENLRDAFREI